MIDTTYSVFVLHIQTEITCEHIGMTHLELLDLELDVRHHVLHRVQAEEIPVL